MNDILFKTEEFVFSYRVAGILIHNGKVLLQKPTNDMGFAFPGGHSAFGETNAETLIREFKEEMNVDISVDSLKWVAEIFFLWGDKPCHQICNYYTIKLIDETQISNNRMFIGSERIEGRDFDIEFHWIPLNEIKDIEVYPSNAVDLLSKWHEGIQHFVYHEE